MKQVSLILAVVGFFCLGFGVEPAAAQGNGAISSKYDITLVLYNECCDELIEITGTAHNVYNPKTGKSHFNLQNATAEGSNGNTYHGNYVTNSSSQENEDGSFSGWVNVTVHFTSSSGCSFTAHLLYTWSYDDVNGYVQDIKKEEIECDGDLS